MVEGSIRDELIVIPKEDGLEYLVNLCLQSLPNHKTNKDMKAKLHNLCNSNEPIAFSGSYTRNRSARLTTSFCDQLHMILKTSNSDQRKFVEKRVAHAFGRTEEDMDYKYRREALIDETLRLIKQESELCFPNYLGPCDLDFHEIPMLPEYIQVANEFREIKLQPSIRLESVFKELNAFTKLIRKRISKSDERHRAYIYILLILFSDNVKLRVTGIKSLNNDDQFSLSNCLQTDTYNYYRSVAKKIGKNFLIQHRDRFPDLVTIVKTIPRLEDLI